MSACSCARTLLVAATNAITNRGLIAQVKVFTQEDVKGWFTSIDRGSQTQKKLSFLLRCTLKHALLKDLSNGDKLAC